MRLSDDQVTTREVTTWQGLHLLHFRASSCSQKVRILLREKGIDWTSHPVDLARKQHMTSWFLGINPRGVVPVLVHDGVVHVESNDILEYLDREIPSPAEPYFPRDAAEEDDVRRSLAAEDELHMDLRCMTMGFLFPQRLVRRSEEELRRYESEGAEDPSRAKEIAWWREFARHGVTPEQARASFEAFAREFAVLESRLEGRDWLLGDRLSVLEIAWFISLHRLVRAGYPLSRHPRLERLYRRLLERPAFAAEAWADTPGPLGAALSAYQLYRRVAGTTLLDVVEG